MRAAWVRTLYDIGDQGWSVCPCGHVAKMDIGSVHRQWPKADVGALRRAMRCEWCGRRDPGAGAGAAGHGGLMGRHEKDDEEDDGWPWWAKIAAVLAT